MLHNLLTPNRKKALLVDYRTRLATVASFALAAAVFAGVVSLLPTYMHVTSKLNILEEEAARFESEDAASVAAPFNELTASAKLLARLELVYSGEYVADVIREAFDSRPQGISITGFSYDRDTAILTMEGVAETRNSLVAFSRILGESEHFTNVSDPTADLAKSQDIPFRIGCTLVKDK